MNRMDGTTTSSAETGDAIHLFVYGTLRSDRSASTVLEGCQLVTRATVPGTLYGLDGYPALMLYGTTPVHGEVWRCPSDLIWRLDEYEGVETGLFRRIGLEVKGLPCWTYVAGPHLAHELTPERRISSGDWQPDGT